MTAARPHESTAEAGDGLATVERFMQALGARDLQATLAQYAPDAVWEVHVPGGDGLQQGADEIGDLLVPFYIGRDQFEVAGYRMFSQDATVALRCELRWRDRHDGAPCVSHQSHFFEVEDGRIRRHWLYCSGVRVYDVGVGAGSPESGMIHRGHLPWFGTQRSS